MKPWTVKPITRLPPTWRVPRMPPPAPTFDAALHTVVTVDDLPVDHFGLTITLPIYADRVDLRFRAAIDRVERVLFVEPTIAVNSEGAWALGRHFRALLRGTSVHHRVPLSGYYATMPQWGDELARRIAQRLDSGSLSDAFLIDLGIIQPHYVDYPEWRRASVLALLEWCALPLVIEHIEKRAVAA